MALMKARCGFEPVRIELGAWWDDWLELMGQRMRTLKYHEGKWDEAHSWVWWNSTARSRT